MFQKITPSILLRMFLSMCSKTEDISDPRDEIIGQYTGTVSIQEEYGGGFFESDTSYQYEFMVEKLDSNKIRFSPEIPLIYYSIPTEEFIYEEDDAYEFSDGPSYASYSLTIKFDRDSSLLKIVRGSRAGFPSSDFYLYTFAGEKDE